VGQGVQVEEYLLQESLEVHSNRMVNMANSHDMVGHHREDLLNRLDGSNHPHHTNSNSSSKRNHQAILTCSQGEINLIRKRRKDKNVAQCNRSTEINQARRSQYKEDIRGNNDHHIRNLQEVRPTAVLVCHQAHLIKKSRVIRGIIPL
jgi:hypothetical protein